MYRHSPAAILRGDCVTDGEDHRVHWWPPHGGVRRAYRRGQWRSGPPAAEADVEVRIGQRHVVRGREAKARGSQVPGEGGLNPGWAPRCGLVTSAQGGRQTALRWGTRQVAGLGRVGRARGVWQTRLVQRTGDGVMSREGVRKCALQASDAAAGRAREVRCKRAWRRGVRACQWTCRSALFHAGDCCRVRR